MANKLTEIMRILMIDVYPFTKDTLRKKFH